MEKALAVLGLHARGLQDALAPLTLMRARRERAADPLGKHLQLLSHGLGAPSISCEIEFKNSLFRMQVFGACL